MSEPWIETRSEQPYIACRKDVSMGSLGSEIKSGIERVATHLKRADIEPAGPPFIRYLYIDMKEKLGIEVGFPVSESARPADSSLVRGFIPTGRYLCNDHIGAPDTMVHANAELQRWAEDQQAELDVRAEDSGERWAGRFEHLLVGPETEANPQRWVTQLAYRLVD